MLEAEGVNHVGVVLQDPAGNEFCVAWDVPFRPEPLICPGGEVDLPTADLSDAQGDRLQACALQLRSFGGRSAFAGPVATVRCRDDNGLVRAALSEPGVGRVLVVDGGGSLEAALVGDSLAGLAFGNGWSGMVVNGAVRDVVALASLAIGVLALGTNPRRGSRDGAGDRNCRVTFGGVTFRPGALLYADEDGIVVEA